MAGYFIFSLRNSYKAACPSGNSGICSTYVNGSSSPGSSMTAGAGGASGSTKDSSTPPSSPSLVTVAISLSLISSIVGGGGSSSITSSSFFTTGGTNLIWSLIGGGSTLGGGGGGGFLGSIGGGSARVTSFITSSSLSVGRKPLIMRMIWGELTANRKKSIPMIIARVMCLSYSLRSWNAPYSLFRPSKTMSSIDRFNPPVLSIILSL